MFRLTQSKDNAVVATYQYLKAIGAKVTEETVEETLKNHPDYPSLLATSDALNEWHIENVALQIKPEQLSELQTPFLTYLHINHGIFALVKSINDDAIEWVHTTEGFKREKTNDFFNKWAGVVLMAETNKDSGEKNFTENRKKEILNNLRIPFLLIGTLILTISLFYHNFTTDWHYNALLLTKFVGVIISGLLVWQSIDKNNPFIKSLCTPSSSDKSGIGCNEILNSNAAQVTSWLNWAEVGFFYFVSGFMALLINPNLMFLLWFLGATALFYTCWSIYYQGFVAKQWCTLCLTIQGLFVVEFLININFVSELGKHLHIMTVSDLLTLLSGAGVAVLCWIFLKPLLQKSQQVRPLKDDLKRFKSNRDLFLNLLHKQDKMPFVPLSMETIILGNPNAEHTMTMVTNPFCQPCAKAHKIIEEIIDTNENVNCQMIFLASNDDGDKRGIVARTILSLPKDQQAEVLQRWYKNEERNIKKWQTQFGFSENKNTQSIIAQQQAWCELAKVTATPTLYVNGYKMPDLYYRIDLKVLLKYLPTLDLQIEHK